MSNFVGQADSGKMESEFDDCSCSPASVTLTQNNVTMMVLDLRDRDDHRELPHFIKYYKERKNFGNFQLHQLTISDTVVELSENATTSLARIATQETIACSITIEELVADYQGNETFLDQEHLEICEDLINQSIVTELVFIFSVAADEREFIESEYQYITELLFFLEQLNEKRVEMMRENSKIKDIMIFFVFPVARFVVNEKLAGSGLYCDRERLAFNEEYEAISNWAEVNQVKLILYQADIGPLFWWTWVKGPENLVQSVKTCYTSIRNFPKSMSNSIKIAPCLEKTNEVTSGLSFYSNSIGVFFSPEVGNVSVSTDGLEVMLRFTLNKFPVVAIFLEKWVENGKLVIAAFKNIVSTGFERGYQNEPKIYVGMPFLTYESFKNENLEQISDLVKVLVETPLLKLEGIYFNGDDKSSRLQVALSLDLKVRKGTNIRIGIHLTDCVSEINHLITNSTVEFPQQISFIICQVSNVPATNGQTQNLENLLDGHLVMENAFKNILPNVQIHFKLNTVTNSEEESNAKKSFLSFLSDFHQFAEAYTIQYFFPAFDSSWERRSGWWLVESMTEMSNSSNYFEKEAEHLEKPQWRSKEYTTEFTQQNNPSRWVFFGMGTLGTILLIVITIASACGWRMRKRLNVLTNAEVQEFLQGKRAMEQEADEQNQILASLKFNEAYDIQKDELKLDQTRILGRGNFGTVFEANVRGQLVAVKSPKASCSKESFKGMLTEVKLMCYIGQHENVIKFVGAYVKEICKGVIYIATELCGNGSLLLYLRAKQRNMRDVGNSEEIEMEQNRDIGVVTIFKRNSIWNGVHIKAKFHGDLSARNVLLNENLTCKIGDFGLARKLYEYNKYVKKSQEPLPWRWMAFESLKMMEFTVKSDVWSYGVTLWEIFSLGDVPFSGVNWSVNFVQEIKTGLRMVKPEYSTEELYEKIMLGCWNLEPEMRPSFEEIQSFLNGLINSEYRVLE